MIHWIYPLPRMPATTKMNLYLPLASWVRGCSYPIYPIIPWKKPIPFSKLWFLRLVEFSKTLSTAFVQIKLSQFSKSCHERFHWARACRGDRYSCVSDPFNCALFKTWTIAAKKNTSWLHNHCLTFNFSKKPGFKKEDIHSFGAPPNKKEVLWFTTLTRNKKYGKFNSSSLPTTPHPPGLSTCAPVDCCPVWRQQLHEAASGTKASWRIRSRKSMESLWVRRCLEQF